MVKKVTYPKIISLFLSDYSRRIYLGELADELKKPHQTVKPYIRELVRKNILSEKKHGKFLEYALNFKNKLIYDYLTIAEKEKTREFIEYNPLVSILYEKLSPFFKDSTFIIFGSSVKGMKKGSDLDLFVIGKNVKEEIKEFQEVYSKKIHLIHAKTLKEVSLTFIKEVYKKHIILNNTETVLRFIGGLYEPNKLV
jgi:predicted nucleotidyltransferase